MYHQNSIENLALVVISKSKSNPHRVHTNTKIFEKTQFQNHALEHIKTSAQNICNQISILIPKLYKS